MRKVVKHCKSAEEQINSLPSIMSLPDIVRNAFFLTKKEFSNFGTRVGANEARKESLPERLCRKDLHLYDSEKRTRTIASQYHARSPIWRQRLELQLYSLLATDHRSSSVSHPLRRGFLFKKCVYSVKTSQFYNVPITERF